MRPLLMIVLIGAMVLVTGMSVPGHAGTIQLFSPQELNAAAVTAEYTGDAPAILPSPYTLAAGGISLTFTLAQGDLRRADQGNEIGDMVGNFAPETKLLYTNTNTAGEIGGGGAGPIEIVFSSGVTEVGFRAQNGFVGPESFFLSVFNGNTLVGDFSVNGISGQLANDTATFLGVRATEGEVITRLIVSGISGVPDTPENDFAIGPVSFTPTAIPEPTTIALFGMAGLGMMVSRLANRRRLGNAHSRKEEHGMKIKLMASLGLMVFATAAFAGGNGPQTGGLPALSERVTQVEGQVSGVITRVEELEAAKPAACPCFDAAMLSQYQWEGQIGVGGVALDEEGNTIADITLSLVPKAGNDGASITRVDKISPAGQLLSSSFFCTFTDADRPDEVPQGDPAYDPNFPVSVAEQKLTLEEYQACSDTMADLARRRF